MAKPPLNVAQELGILLNGDALETLLDELIDPGANFTAGQRARLGSALIGVGTALYDGSKAGMDTFPHIESEVIFKWRDGYSRTNVNATQVKAQYPKDKHPSLYNESHVDGGVTVEVPFDNKNLALPKLDVPDPVPVQGIGQQGSMIDDFPDFAQPEPALPEPFA